MSELADDIASLLDYFGIRRAHAVIGVSQGGAAVLQFGLRYPERTTRIVVCDTQAKSPEVDIVPQHEIEWAKREGMRALATYYASMWFPIESEFHPSSGSARSKAVLDMIAATPVAGFEAGARSLRNYDLFADELLQSKVKTLLVVGEQDKVLRVGLEQLSEVWAKEGGDVRFVEVKGVGHLPMLDGAQSWLHAIVAFLGE